MPPWVHAAIVYAYPPVIAASLLWWLAALAAAAPLLVRECRRLIGARHAAALAAILAVGGGLRAWGVPRLYRNVAFEPQHLRIANTLAERGVFSFPLVRGEGDFDVHSPPIWPAGYHLLMALVRLGWGPEPETAFRFNIAQGTLAILILFLAATHMFSDPVAGLASAGLLAILPLHVRLSACAEYGINAFLWVVGALLTLSLYRARPSARTSMLFLATLNYAIHGRCELLVLAPLLAAATWGGHHRLAGQAAVRAGQAAVALAAVPAALVALHNHADGQPGWDTAPAALAGNFLNYFPDNLSYFLNPASPNLALLLACVAAVVGRGAPARAWRALLGGMLLVLLAVYGVFGAFSTRDPTSYAPERYALIPFAPLLLLAGVGARRLAAGTRAPAAGILAALFLAAVGADFRRGEPALSEIRERLRLFTDAKRFLPPGIYVAAFSPDAIAVLRPPLVSGYFLLESRERFDAALSSQGRSQDLILFEDVPGYEPRGPASALRRNLGRDYDSTRIHSRRIGGHEYAFHYLRRRRRPPA